MSTSDSAPVSVGNWRSALLGNRTYDPLPLSPSMKLVALALLHWEKNGANIFPTHARIAKAVELSEGSVSKHMRALQFLGLLEQTRAPANRRRPDQRTAVYRLGLPPNVDETCTHILEHIRVRQPSIKHLTAMGVLGYAAESRREASARAPIPDSGRWSPRTTDDYLHDGGTRWSLQTSDAEVPF